jgi:hypothetical protein
MLQTSGRTRLAEEAVAPGRVGGACLSIVEHLDRDIAFEMAIEGAMDAGYSPGTDDLAQLVTIGEESRHRAGSVRGVAVAFTAGRAIPLLAALGARG